MIEINKGKFKINFSTKVDGNMSLRYGDTDVVTNNRVCFFQACSINQEKLLTIIPTHSNNIEFRDSENKSIVYQKEPVVIGDFDGFKDGIDGCLTMSESPIGIMTGDCVPLIVFHKESGLHGIVHVGLLGVVNNIVQNLEVMFKDLKIETSSVNYYMGPSIKQDNYELNKSNLWLGIRERVSGTANFINQFVTTDGTSMKFDLQSAIKYQLEKIGADIQNIVIDKNDSGETNSLFYSHYISHCFGLPDGRFYSVISSSNK